MKENYTLYELNRWYRQIYEKLPWIIIAFEYKKHPKVNNYIDSIKSLNLAIHNKILKIKDKDTKEDLKILYEKTSILNSHIIKIFTS